MKYCNEKFLVFGLKSSGAECVEFLLSKNALVGIFDENEEALASETCRKLLLKGAVIACDTDNADKSEETPNDRFSSIYDYDVVVVSPGVPADNKILVKLKRLKKRILGELELAYLNCKAPVIAISGTNGKTTVSTAVHEALTKSGETCYLLGNVGVPFIKYADDTLQTDLCVVEVSSFQLETINQFTPHVAVMLNVTEDHLDRHYTMDNYVYLKKRLFKNQRESEWAVLNYDDETVRSFASDLRSKIVWFSRKEKVEGAYIRDGFVYYRDEKITAVSDLSLKGAHNEENFLACVCALKTVGTSSECIVKCFSNVKGLPFRTENVGEYNGVTYYNDSKSTNVDSTLKAMESIDKPTVLILGGRSKNQDFTPIFKAIKEGNGKIKHVILTGESRFSMLEDSLNLKIYDVSVVSDLLSAVRLAKSTAEEGDAVLFSPATASFDAFKDYVDRGEKFNYLVRGLNEEKCD